MAFLIGLCPAPEMLDAERAWVRSLSDALRPHTMGPGTYVNALDGTAGQRIRDSYGHKYDRLAAIKARYDPENLFRRNANIEPAR